METWPDKLSSRERVRELTVVCVAGAAELSFTIDGMVPEWDSVESIIYKAITHLDEPGTPCD